MLNVLVVEDNLMNQRLLEKTLEKDGHSFHMAKNGVEALALFLKHGYDLVLMDIRMPVMDGVETTRNIRHLEGEMGRKPVPVYAMTANVIEQDWLEYEAAGMVGYLAKPFRLYALRKLLEKVAADRTIIPSE